MIQSSGNAKRVLSWFKARRCYKKFYRGGIYYLPGDGSRQDTQANYEAALQQWAVRKQELDAQEQDRKIATTVSKTFQQISKYTEELRNGTCERFEELGVPMERPKVATGPLSQAAKAYLNDAKGRAQRAEISIGRYEKLVSYVERFVNTVGAKVDCNSISELTLQDYRRQITACIGKSNGKGLGDYTARYTLQEAATFVDWLWMSKLLVERPRNISTFKKVKVARRPVRCFRVDEIKAIWQACSSDWQRLFVAIALNTAMNQSDIGRLTPRNLDLPFLVLKRGKTGVVGCWKLWAVTQKLIESCKRANLKHPDELLFLTQDGRPLVERGFRPDGRTFKNDAVRQVFKRVLKKAKVSGKFVMLRKTVATVLKARGYGDVVQFFLCHDNDALVLSNGFVTSEPANGSVAETFYIEEQAKIQALKNHPRLLEALDMLEKEFGLADAE